LDLRGQTSKEASGGGRKERERREDVGEEGMEGSDWKGGKKGEVQ